MRRAAPSVAFTIHNGSISHGPVGSSQSYSSVRETASQRPSGDHDRAKPPRTWPARPFAASSRENSAASVCRMRRRVRAADPRTATQILLPVRAAGQRRRSEAGVGRREPPSGSRRTTTAAVCVSKSSTASSANGRSWRGRAVGWSAATRAAITGVRDPGSGRRAGRGGTSAGAGGTSIPVRSGAAPANSSGAPPSGCARLPGECCR